MKYHANGITRIGSSAAKGRVIRNSDRQVSHKAQFHLFCKNNLFGLWGGEFHAFFSPDQYVALPDQILWQKAFVIRLCQMLPFFTYLLHDIPKIWIIYLKKKSPFFFFTTMSSAWWFTVSKKNKYHFLFRFFVYWNTNTQTQNKIYHFLLLHLLKLKHWFFRTHFGFLNAKAIDRTDVWNLRASCIEVKHCTLWSPLVYMVISFLCGAPSAAASP